MLASACCTASRWAPCPARPVRQRLQRPAVARARPTRRLQARAFKEGGSNGSSALASTPDQQHTAKMVNLVVEYFNEAMTRGNPEICRKILSPRVEHRDMVRNEGRYGISDYEDYIRALKAAYPDIYVKPTQFGVVDDHSMFVAFEGRATPHTEVFKGVDLFRFNDDASKISCIEVYRSNWLGAHGHEERKKAAQQGRGGGVGQPGIAT